MAFQTSRGVFSTLTCWSLPSCLSRQHLPAPTRALCTLGYAEGERESMCPSKFKAHNHLQGISPHAVGNKSMSLGNPLLLFKGVSSTSVSENSYPESSFRSVPPPILIFPSCHTSSGAFTAWLYGVTLLPVIISGVCHQFRGWNFESCAEQSTGDFCQLNVFPTIFS